LAFKQRFAGILPDTPATGNEINNIHNQMFLQVNNSRLEEFILKCLQMYQKPQVNKR